MKKYWILVIMVGMLLSACKDKENQQANNQQTQQVETYVTAPFFDEDSAFYFVAKQCEFGPRVPNTDAAKECGDWLIEKLDSYSDTIYVQNINVVAYNGEVLKGRNIIASFNPESSARIFLSAHWDSRPYADHDADSKYHNTPIDGANDGASGVGILIELARVMSQEKPNIGVDIVLFDAEDYGAPQGTQNSTGDDWGLGSQYWSRMPHTEFYTARYGILLDMVGGANPNFTYEGFSHQYAGDILQKVWNIAHFLGYTNEFSDEKTPYITDDHYYVNTIAQIPTIDIIHYEHNSSSGFYTHWHTMQDNIDNIDKTTLGIVGRVVSTVVYNEK